MIRCCNIDWLEVYALESNDRFPCNADYFREHGYFVKERDYGTRTYKEMFTIEDSEGHDWIEVRRNPASGESSFTGLVPQSCHLRLVNQQCYYSDCVNRLREFMLKHEYLFQRIFRIDVCYDFTKFDTGDRPAKFARRYVEKVYRKINQSHLAAWANDNWTDFDWESLSWGSPTSMVSTKMYNKSKELSAPKKDKPYIRYAWFVAGLISNPITGEFTDEKGKVTKPDVWRIEFSMKSTARDWLVIQSQAGKRPHKKAIPHTLSLFDSPDKLWQRFQDLSFHYFRFKIFEEGKRKDRCKDKVLFYWDRDREVMKLDTLPPASRPDRDEVILMRRLQRYKEVHFDKRINDACAAIIDAIKRRELLRLNSENLTIQTEALQRVIQLKMGGDQRSVVELTAEIIQLLQHQEIF